MPRTRLGFWALRLLALFAALFALTSGLAAATGGHRWLAVPGLTSLALGLVGGVTALVAIVRRGERSALVLLPLLAGLLVLVFLFGELVIGHD